MIILVSSSAKSSHFGAEDYSYYFVLKQFLPVLKKIGLVLEVDAVADVDRIYKQLSSCGVGCVFLCFSPPHKVVSGLECPTIPIFAWEYGTIPNESWSSNPKNNWVAELKKYAAAITHSEHSVGVTKAAVGDSYPITSIPAPIWDQYSQYFDEKSDLSLSAEKKLRVNGWVLDTADVERSLANRSDEASEQTVTLSGVVYTSVFTPNDGRKNWQDLVTAYCYAFKSVSDVTLVLKLTHTDPKYCFEVIYSELKRLLPFKCRVVVIQGFLPDDDYARLIAATKYSVNSSFGEGQCLPLMEYMSAGKPSVAPNHTGMEDYITSSNSFVVDSSRQWTHWPHDPRQVLRTFRQTINWESLCAAYMNSYIEIKNDPVSYRRRSNQAFADLRKHCSNAQTEKKLKAVLVLVRKNFRIRQRILYPFYRVGWCFLSRLGLIPRLKKRVLKGLDVI